MEHPETFERPEPDLAPGALSALSAVGAAGRGSTAADRSRDERASTGPSLASSLGDLLTGSQGMITKRIDLAMLEGSELISRFAERTTLVALAVLLVAGAWFSTMAALVLYLAADANLPVRLVAFGLLNAGGAFAFYRMSMRPGPAPTSVRSDDGGGSPKHPQPSLQTKASS